MSKNQISNNESQASLQVEALNNVAVNKHQVNVTMISIVLLIFLIDLGSQMLSNYQDKMQILYVSRSEIMDLEKARVEQSQDLAGRMFFGAINKAISLIRREVINYEDNYHRVIFVGDNYVEGRNTKSISKEVYEKVIHRLKTPKSSS